MSLLGQVLISAAVLVPSQPPLVLGVEIELVAAYVLARGAHSIDLTRRGFEPLTSSLKGKRRGKAT